MTGVFDPDSPDAEAIVQAPVLGAAHAFLRVAVRDGDLLGAWRHIDPLLRTCWAQHWLHPNQDQLRADGYDRDEVARALAADAPAHPLLTRFTRLTVRSLRASFHQAVGAEPDNWGIGTSPRVLGVDAELLYVHDTTALPGGVWQPDSYSHVMPMVMRYAEDEWRVLNIGAATMPAPGWPPRLWAD